MKGLGPLFRLTAMSFAGAMASVATASIPPNADMAPALHAQTMIYELNTEMVVRDWVLCISLESAEQLVQAREESDKSAWLAFVALRDAKTCGLFPELRVILKTPLYTSPKVTGGVGRIYGGLVQISNRWASAYLVHNGLPVTAHSTTEPEAVPPDLRKGI